MKLSNLTDEQLIQYWRDKFPALIAENEKMHQGCTRCEKHIKDIFSILEQGDIPRSIKNKIITRCNWILKARHK